MRSPRFIGAFLGATLIAGVLSVVVIAAAPPMFQEIEESLTCQCGCGLTVASCNHLQCGSALPLRAEIREQLSKGKNKREILAYFVDKYGEKILSSPTTTGFNLVAWVTPFALVSFGAVFIAAVLLRWSRQRAVPVAPHGGAEPGPQVPTAYEKILERELKDFEG